MDRPLVSFCLKSYNQRQYILAALEGALSQTYRPLEIVISDDGSTDGSWEAIQEKVAAFRATASGEVLARLSFVLNRNETNLGNLGNWERICELAHGALLVKADGDDVSLPERTERIVSAWLADGCRATVITHAAETVPGGRIVRGRHVRWPLGAAMAWSRECFDGWPAIGEDCRRAYDDQVYSFRAWLCGPEIVLDDVLVRYRIGSGDTTGQYEYRRPFLQCLFGERAALPQQLRDLAAAVSAGRVTEERAASEKERLLSADKYNAQLIDLLSSESLIVRGRAFKIVRTHYNFKGKVFMATALLPRWLGDVVFGILMRLRRAF